MLLHGASGSGPLDRNVVPLAARFRVLAPDMPGFGDSDTPPSLTPPTGWPTSCPDSTTSAGAARLAGFSFGGIIGGLGPRGSAVASHGGAARVGWPGPGRPARPLQRIDAAMAPEEVRRVHRSNLRTLMLGSPESADDLAVFLHIENLTRARFKSGTIPQSDVLRRALPAIRARIAGIWGGRDAFTGARLEECRQALASVQGELDLRVIDPAGHWVIYEAADQANAALLDLLALPSVGADVMVAPRIAVSYRSPIPRSRRSRDAADKTGSPRLPDQSHGRDARLVLRGPGWAGGLRGQASVLCTYDDEHHRVAFLDFGPLAPRDPAATELGVKPAEVPGVHHVAFTSGSMGEFLDNYVRLRDPRITPFFCVNHGPTTSMYYRDPDGNRVELQIDNFATAQEGQDWMLSPAFAQNPIGVEFAPDELVVKFRSGVPVAELVVRD